jgi:hypothetical protein
MKPIVFSRHARRRMKWRRISEEQASEIVRAPEKSGEDRGRIVARRRVDGRWVVVAYKETDEQILVVTAYRKGGTP